jgi:4-hydroxybutyrate CoA-transferase
MAQWCALNEAVKVVQSGDRVYAQGACMTPVPLLEALTERGPELRDVEITHMHTHGPVPYTDEKWTGHFTLRSLFVGENARAAANAGRASYTPIFLHDIPALFHKGGALPIDVAFIQVSPPDANGYCSLGTSVDVTRSAVDNARCVVALVNPNAPRTHGDAFVHIDRINYAVEYDGPLHVATRRQPDAVQLQIGRHVATLIEDGATLQLGIGAIPDAVLASLTDRKDLGVHTEMFSDGVMELVQRGVITGARKAVDPGKLVASFLNGTRKLLDFVHDNPLVSMRPTDYTNDTAIIRRFEHMVAVNSAIQVDLTGQVCAESIGSYLMSGVGGQMDFMRGAALSSHGRPIIALPSTASAKHYHDDSPLALVPHDGVISRIVPMLTPGSAVTTTRAHAHYVITEYGIASLHGADISERVRRLIAVSHPAFREDLEQLASKLHLI